MKNFSSKIGLLGAAVILAVAIPVVAQDSPESLLPPGFGDPEPILPPSEAAPASENMPSTAQSTGTASRSGPPASASLPRVRSAAPALVRNTSATSEDDDEDEEAKQEEYDLPPTSRRSLEQIGLINPSTGGLGPSAFGVGNGKRLAAIMREARAPFASRWGQILLRRALISRTDTPTDIDGADWIAERAWLLLRMGEADNARLLIQSVDSDRYTERLYAVAMQVQLAAADPAGFCPLLPRALRFNDEPSWFMARAICASFSADQGAASSLLNQANRRRIASGIDYRLAEKAVGSGPNSRRSVTIEWDGVDRLTTWRFGLATATNVEIPAQLYRTVGDHVRAWEARAPMLGMAKRLPGSYTAARLGVFSGMAERDFLIAMAARDDAVATASDIGDLLYRARRGSTLTERISAMREFWRRDPADGSVSGPGDVDYGALPAIAQAAAALPPTNSAGDDTPWLIAAMLTGGYDRNAEAWAPMIKRLSGPARQRGWALLATGLPATSVSFENDRIRDFLDSDGSEGALQSRMLIAALAGLDRLPTDTRAELMTQNAINASPQSRWARAMVAAAQRQETGTVALLCGIGMQVRDWREVPPQHLYFIVSALRQVGLDPYARMIAAEAMARI